MKAIVIYEEEYSGGGWDYEGVLICDVVIVTDEQLENIDINYTLLKGQKYQIVDVKQARIETKNVLKWGE